MREKLHNLIDTIQEEKLLRKPYYAMLDDMIEPINLEVVGEKKE